MENKYAELEEKLKNIAHEGIKEVVKKLDEYVSSEIGEITSITHEEIISIIESKILSFIKQFKKHPVVVIIPAGYVIPGFSFKVKTFVVDECVIKIKTIRSPNVSKIEVY